MPIRVVSTMLSCGMEGASLMYSGGVVRSVLFCERDIFMAMHSLLGPLVRLALFPCLAPRRFIIISWPATGSRALMRTASGFPGACPVVMLKQ